LLNIIKNAKIKMNWQITFYNSRVEQTLLAWPNKLRTKLARILELIIDYGPNLGMPFTKAMHDGLFEMRVKAQEGIGRVFFCYVVKKGIIILHSFIKKTQHTPLHEIKIARKRLQEILKNEL
jgi:phage-related protein